MNITIIGSGYVGLVSATGFALKGNKVCCVDIDESKVDLINKGKTPIYEKNLEEHLSLLVAEKKIYATTSIEEGARFSNIIFIAVGTPSSEDGSSDMQYVYNVVESIIPHLTPDTIIVNKSTVPVGTQKKLTDFIQNNLKTKMDIPIISNPEFLKEGEAVLDFLEPDRVVIGGEHQEAMQIIKKLYLPFVKSESQILLMDALSSEMTKYAANTILASRVVFINEIARLSSKLGADIEQIRKGLGSDSRIGDKFLKPSIGYGGSCFPKDVKALIYLAKENGINMPLINSIHTSNSEQFSVFIKMIENNIENLSDKKVAVWGGAFKAGTDDTRDSQAVFIIKNLSAKVSSINVYDPEAFKYLKNDLKDFHNIQYCNDPYECLNESDFLCILTEWEEFVKIDLQKVKNTLLNPIIFDGRNLYSRKVLKEFGFKYYSMGRNEL